MADLHHQRRVTREPRPRLLIVAHDHELAAHLLLAVDRACSSPETMLTGDRSRGPVGCRRSDEAGFDGCCCRLAWSLGQLHELDLGTVDLILCDTDLPDGTGIDALAYLRGIRPELPVVLTSAVFDPELGLEAIQAGAADYVGAADLDRRTLALLIAKSLAQHRMREDNERLHRELNRSLAEEELKHQQLRDLVQQLEVMARTDELTGLCNRRWLNLTVQGVWAEADRHGLPLAFMMIDLDGFKRVNDLRGHHQGDRILRVMGRVIQANCRQVDVAARFGGDEFCVLLPHTEVSEAEQVAARIIRQFEEAIGRMGPEVATVGMSVGIAHNRLSRPASADQLVRHADEAMYEAKAMEGNRVVVKTPPAGGAPAATSDERSAMRPRDGSITADRPAR